MTLHEYLALSPRRRFLYRAARHPVVAQLILPPVVFLLLYRLSFDTPKTARKERRSVRLTNLALAVALVGLALVLGWGPVLLVQLCVMVLASIAGVWLFSVQHRFEGVEWMRDPDWTPLRASLQGSSYLRLPRLLQWFTGNIGFHHVHHLLPRVPNYRLQECHEALLASAGAVRTLSFWDALRAPGYALWDEARSRMVPFPRPA
jgi:omega-6 fatty acid desaturase (delta-12 desaturase)